MNTLLYIMETFTNSGKPWEQQEDDQLNTLYNVDILDIMAISKIHKRTPGGIISRLLKREYITTRNSVRGYDLYRNSDLYKEIVETNKKETTNTDYYIELQNDVKEIKNEIKELQKTILELVEMMKAV